MLGKELTTAAKDGSTHRILVFAATKKDVDEVLMRLTALSQGGTFEGFTKREELDIYL